MPWPDLSTIKFVSNRLATEEDLAQGAAVFLMKPDNQNPGVPINIALPQYAIHTDERTGEKSNVVVIQAEEANNQQIFGALVIATNTHLAGMSSEFLLLGDNKPN